MRKELFCELVESVKEGMAILRGEMEPSREFVVEKKEKPDVKSIRSKFGISRRESAASLGISVRTLENWEQGHRTPKGPAKVLLQVRLLIRKSCGKSWEPNQRLGSLNQGP